MLSFEITAQSDGLTNRINMSSIDDGATTMTPQVKAFGAILVLLWLLIPAAGLYHPGYCFTHMGAFVLLSGACVRTPRCVAECITLTENIAQCNNL